MKPVIDNFSLGSADYAAFRPESPVEIYDFLYQNVERFDAAWDCGTGNGQVAGVLAERFGHVYGTDISGEQLALAVQKDNITYLQQRAELTTLPANSIDLLTVAQAIHWFDLDKFYAEVRRVARPGAVIGAWSYIVLRVTPEVDAVVDHLYNNITHQHWDSQRTIVDELYKTIAFPFEEIDAPVFGIHKQWNLQQLVGYLNTWSGLKNYVKAKGQNPLELVVDDLEQAWGNDELLDLRWAVHGRFGRVE